VPLQRLLFETRKESAEVEKVIDQEQLPLGEIWQRIRMHRSFGGPQDDKREKASFGAKIKFGPGISLQSLWLAKPFQQG